MKRPVKGLLMMNQYCSNVNRISRSIFNPGRYMTTMYELHDTRNTSGRLMLVTRRDTLFITAVFTSDDPFWSFLEGSSGKITTQNREHRAEEIKLIPL